MNILEIPVKFQHGDIIYTIKKTRVETNCEICEGEKTIDYKGKNMTCPECRGVGKFTSSKTTNVVCDEPFVIRTTKISINSNGNATVKHKGSCGLKALNRSEETLFRTKEEATEKCKELNKETVILSVSDIIVPKHFKDTPTFIEKIQRRLDYYRTNGKFKKDIIINKDNILLDGYISYLLCKLLGIEVVKAVVEI